MQSTAGSWAPESHSHNWFRRPWKAKYAAGSDPDMSSLLRKDHKTQQGPHWSHSTTSLTTTSPPCRHDQHVQYNQYAQSTVSLTSSTSPYGNAKITTMHNIIQEMEQDEERRLAQIKQNSTLLSSHPFYDRQKQEFLSRNRSHSLGRHELPMNARSVYVAQLPDFGSRNSMSLVQAGDVHRTTAQVPRYLSEMEDSSAIRPTELEVPDIKICSPNYDPYAKEYSVVPSELECKTEGSGWPQRDVKADVHELPIDSLYSELDVLVSSKQNPYAARRISSTSAIELDAGYAPLPHSGSSGLPDLPELPPQTSLSPTSTADERNSSKTLPPAPQAALQAIYGDRRYRTLAGEAFPLSAGRWSG